MDLIKIKNFWAPGWAFFKKVAIKQRLEGAEGVNHQIYGRRTSQTEGTGRAQSRVVGSLNKQQRPACIGHSEQRKELSWKQEKSYKVSQAISSTSAWLYDPSSLLSQTGSSGLETGIGREHKDTKPDVFKLFFFSFPSVESLPTFSFPLALLTEAFIFLSLTYRSKSSYFLSFFTSTPGSNTYSVTQGRTLIIHTFLKL